LSYRPGYPPTALVVVTAGAGVEPARQVSLLRSPDATPCCSPNARRPDSTPAPTHGFVAGVCERAALRVPQLLGLANGRNP